MTTLLLIRHGQASFGSGDYDRLCDGGIRQARLLGEYLARDGRRPVVAISGTLRRQAETAEHALAAAGLACPITEDSAFDEYPSDALFAAYMPAVVERHPEMADAWKLRADRRLFQKALEGVLARWQASSTGLPEHMTWPAFRRRVHAGLEAAVAASGHDDVIAIFTSGGVIGTAVGEALGLAPQACMALSWRIHNASISEIHYGRSGFALAGFNAVAHLRLAGEPGLLTYR